jgi:vitamin B12 transporter
MKTLTIAGLAGLASLGAQAQSQNRPVLPPSFDPVVVTATRALSPSATLRDAIVITRDDLDAAGPLSLAEVLQRRAGIEFRGTGGPGQPQTLFIRGAGSAQTLVLVDGLRVGSATVGTTSIEHIPLEMIERIEVVKGPLSSLYGPEAIGGVIQIFTRGRNVPHLFVSAAYGTDRDRRASAGLASVDGGTSFSISTGVRKVDAPSATNPRAAFGYNPDRDPYSNAFATVRAAQKLWQGETIEVEAFTSRARTYFDAGSASNDRNDQQISGAKLSSSATFTNWWTSRITIGQGRDRLAINGDFPGVIETRQDQASWINELNIPSGNVLLGAETLRQKVLSDESAVFTRNKRDTNSAFIGANQSLDGQRLEVSARRDDDDQFGARNTGAASYGLDFPQLVRLSATYARGFRAPTFFDLYGSFPGYTPNPALQPEKSRSYEYTARSDPKAALQWRLTAFDNRFENLLVFTFSGTSGTVVNAARARARGIEAALETDWLATRWRASFTAQRPRDEDTGLRLQGRAERFGTLEATRSFGSWTAGVTVVASGPRYDSTNEAPASRLGGYAVVDARLRYAFAKGWTAEVAAANLGDKRREAIVGYDAPRRTILLNVRFDAF